MKQYKIIMAMAFFALASMNLVAMHPGPAESAPGVKGAHEHQAPVAAGARLVGEPKQAWLWNSAELNKAQSAKQAVLLPGAKQVSQFGAYVGIKPQGILVSSESSIRRVDNPKAEQSAEQQDMSFGEVSDVLTSEQKEKQKDLNFVAKQASKLGENLGMRSRGWLLEKSEKAIEKPGIAVEQDKLDLNLEHQERLVEELDIVDQFFGEVTEGEAVAVENLESQGDVPGSDASLQEYKDYYGVSFGPAFFKLSQSVPEAFKSMDGFQESMTYFFDVFRVRAKHLGKTEGEYWSEYLSDGFHRFAQIFVRKFDEFGELVMPETIDMNDSATTQDAETQTESILEHSVE
ncbi:hypothetical protein KBC04_04030 [Candidatus Babeliales bacterium]|nr:hypothetical protein [Candidatus Babeliales bacterium]MBP9843335.1 hypothetical protein [Candidatus Babeliales bacterium]